MSLAKRTAQLKETGIMTADTLVKTGKGWIVSITIAWTNCVAGNFINLRDGLNVAAPVEVLFMFPTAIGTLTKEWPEGKEFETGIFYNEGALPAGGEVWTEMTYR